VVAGIYFTIKRLSLDWDGGGNSLEWVEHYLRLELRLKLKGGVPVTLFLEFQKRIEHV
jgi:hypothetical protein